MTKSKKWISSLLISFSVLFVLSGCSANRATINWYDFGAEYHAIESAVIAENQTYSLIWDKETACVTLADKKGNYLWSNIPTDAKDVTTHPQVYSPILVEYIEKETLNSNKADSYTACIKKDAFAAERIDNGIQVTYYFEDIAISIPVKYVLREDSIQVSIDPSQIGEDEQLCANVSLLPFMCAVNNTLETKESYLFVPSGSGALVYPKIIGEGITSFISEAVYGADAQSAEYPATEKETVHLPVYGVKNDKHGMCAIIENSAETAEITTNIGSSTYGYSSVYATFDIRGSQISTAQYMGGFSSEKVLFESTKVENEIVVGFYPLTEEKANYEGMAKCYQNYLIEQQGMTSKQEDTLLNLKIIGGVKTKKFLFGVPYTSLMPVTEFEDVNSISTDIQKYYSGKTNINLIGFGQSGLNIEKVAGGVAYNTKFGSIKELRELQENEDVSLYFDFDILRFSKGGKGVNLFNGMAKSAVGGKNLIRYTNIPFSEIDWTKTGHYMVRRDALASVSNKILKEVEDWNLGGISYGSLTEICYSDYTDAQYCAKSNFGMQTKEIIERTQAEGYKVAANGANDYAAYTSDQIYDTPTESSGYQVFDCDIPFYQLVFKGYTPMSVKSMNFATNHRDTLLKAVESGCGLTYTLIANYDTDILTSDPNAFYSAVYEDNADVIKEDIKQYQSVFDAVSNETIAEHNLLSDTLRQTVYANGVTVFVNYADVDVVLYDGSIVSAKGFLMKGVEAQ